MRVERTVVQRFYLSSMSIGRKAVNHTTVLGSQERLKRFPWISVIRFTFLILDTDAETQGMFSSLCRLWSVPYVWKKKVLRMCTVLMPVVNPTSSVSSTKTLRLLFRG